ncbi:hypothetical protein PRIC1_010656 [Phytophthora ramorum]
MVAPQRPRTEQAANPRQEYREKFGRPARHVPTDKFFADIDEAIANKVSAQEIRVLALREVQRSRVAVDDKVKLFIPAARIASVYGVEDILHAINREPQSPTWDQALNSLCDFVCVRGHGIRFTCTHRDLAIKIGSTAVSCMDQKLIVKPYRAYERYYYVDLTRIPSDLDEDVIYDYFVALGLQPIVAPTHQAGSLMSRDRTVWFPNHDVPDALMLGGQPLREIFFDGFDSPVYVQHKKRSLNKVVPPSIAAKRTRAADQQRLASEAAAARRATSPAQRRPVTPVVATPPQPPLRDGNVILERPAASAPVQEWVKVTRHALCSTLPPQPPTAEVEVSTTSDSDGRLVFGFPVKPTSFELAFSDLDYDEPTAGDADCSAFINSDAVACSPLALAEPVGELVASHSVLRPKTNAMKRSEYRRRARKAAQDLLKMSEPDGRLAAMTAQPSAYAALVHASPDELAPVVEEHALLRLYSGKPSTSHGTDRSLMHRVSKDYPGDASPTASAILADQVPDDTYRDTARAYARVDLFFRTHAPAIYHDPIKVQALCGDTAVSSYQYSNFLLWTDQTLAALCASRLGQEYEQYLGAAVHDALRTVLDDRSQLEVDSISMASSADSEATSDAAKSTADETMGSPESPEATHL